MSVTINGKTYQGRNIQVINNRVIIDGKEVTEKGMAKNGILKVQVEGTLESLITDASVEAGLVKGDIQAGGSVSCDDVDGDVQAGGSVTCGKVGGDIMAGGSVRHG